MNPTQAIAILQALADGRDPATGQPFPPDSPYQQADTVRALYTALEALAQPAAKPKRPADPDRLQVGKPWTPEEEQRLRDAFAAQTPIAAIAAAHGRTRGAISSRLIRLGLLAPAPVSLQTTAFSPTASPASPAAPTLTPDDLKSLPF